MLTFNANFRDLLEAAYQVSGTGFLSTKEYLVVEVKAVKVKRDVHYLPKPKHRLRIWPMEIAGLRQQIVVLVGKLTN